MKLYEVPPKTWIKIAGEKIFFDHLDGMYSYCLDEGGNVVHIDRKSTRLNSSHMSESRMPSSA